MKLLLSLEQNVPASLPRIWQVQSFVLREIFNLSFSFHTERRGLPAAFKTYQRYGSVP